MFWSNMTSSPLDSLLEQPDTNLLILLDQPEVLQECKAGNRKLLDFLQRTESMQAMLDLITKEPDERLPMAKQYQYPNIACEVLSSDNSFCGRLTEDRNFLSVLFNFFRDSPVPMNPILASYISRVMSHIVIRESQSWYTYQINGTHLVNYLDDSTDDIIGWFLNHIGTSAVCDLLYNMIVKLEDTRKNLIDWLVKGKFVERLLQQLGSEDPEIHEGVKSLVEKILADYQTTNLESDAIYDALKLPSTVATVLNVIFHNEEICQSSIINGLNVVVALLGITTPQVLSKQISIESSDPNNTDPALKPEMESLIISRFGDLQKVLTKEPKEEIVLTTGVVSRRVGKGRLAILKFYAQILSLRQKLYIDEMVNVGALKYIMDMFWANEHNSFLHKVVENIVTQIVLTPQENKGLEYLMYEGKFMEKVLEKFDEKNCGYRGHIARMAHAFYDTTHSCGPQLDMYKRREQRGNRAVCNDWEIFVWNTLEDYIVKQQKFLGGFNPHRKSKQRSHGQSPTTDDWGDTQSAFPADFQTDYGVFSAPESFAEEGLGGKKDMFEMFCCDRNGLNDDDFCLSDEEKFEADPDFSFTNPDSDFSFPNPETDFSFTTVDSTTNPTPDFNLSSPISGFNPSSEFNLSTPPDFNITSPDPELTLT